MKTIISPGEQLKFKPIKKEIQNEFKRREENKEYVYNLTPFVRISCLQEVTYTEENTGRNNSLKGIKDSILTDSSRFNGFVFRFDSTFDESYGEVQKIGKTLDGDDINIKNPRRVPPPQLKSFTADVGENSDYYTTSKLTFTCNSLEQLQFISPFLFNPGNSIFIEFGHNNELMKNISMFDSNDANDLINSMVLDSNCKPTGNGGFIERMNKRIFDSGGAYDFFFGQVSNMNFELNDNLGFDCVVDLVSVSKMKLTADKYKVYNNPVFDNNNLEQDRITSITLQSELKHFRDTLERRNKKLNKDIIFSFSDVESDVYIRLDDIFGFLNGEYSKNVFDTTVSKNNVAVNLNESTNGNSTQIDNILFSDIRVKKSYPNTPPIVSYSSDLLLFRNRMWDPDIKYDDKEGIFSINSNGLSDYKEWSSFLKNSSYFDINDPANVSGRGDRIISKRYKDVSAKFEIIKPYTLDTPQDDKVELLQNSYINYNKFKSIYLASKGNVHDSLKKICNLINDATDGMWDIRLLGDASVPENRTDTTDNSEQKCEHNVSGLISNNSFDIDTGETYTFKINSKKSIFGEISFELGLDGILGNQIYMNAINSTNGSIDSQKLNLLLFSNHENNLRIIDKRNRKVESIRKQLKEQEKKNNKNGSTDKSDDINKKVKSADLKRSFLGSYIVGERGGADVSKVPTFYDNMDLSIFGYDPKTDPINKFENVRVYDNRVGRSTISYTKQQILNNIFKMYDVEIIPLVFTPLKEAINAIRAKKNPKIKPTSNTNLNDLKSNFTNNTNNNNVNNRGINPLLESKVNITLPGIGGINPLEYVKIDGIPDVYSKRGEYCIMNVSHTITPEGWNTELSTRMRVRYNDE